MRILITGNMGYVGPWVVRRLREAYPAAVLLGLDAGFFAHCLTAPEIVPESRLDVQYFADIRDFPLGTLRGVDAVVHLAAISNDPMGNCYQEVTMEINHSASVRLAETAREAGVRSFVYASSCSVYGSAQEDARNEDSELSPLTAYARSKVLTETDLRKLASPSFKVTCLRFATACGMSDRLRLDLVLNDFAAAAMASHEISILSDGTPWRPLINVKDMARAVEWAVTRELSCGGEYLVVNVGSQEWNFQVKDLAGAVQQVFTDVTVSINPNASPDKRSYRVDFSRFKRLAPSHQPEMDLITTIIELKHGLERMHFNDRDFRNSSLIRLRILSELRSKGLVTENLSWCAPEAVSPERQLETTATAVALN